MLGPLRRTVVALLAAFILAAPTARAQAPQEFYKGKLLTLTVGYGPGGGYDLFARLVAKHIGRFIAGNPSVIVQNMPGAGSLIAANYLYSVAPRDGSAFGLFARDLPLLGIMGHNDKIQFDPRKYTWLGSSSDFSDDAYVMVVRNDAPAKTIDYMRTAREPLMILGGTADGTSGADVPRTLQQALGLNMKLVLGYRDSAAIFLAMERNEVFGRITDLSAIRSNRAAWLKPGGGYRVLLQFARIKRHPDFPDVPTARELATTEAGRTLIEFTETPLLTMARPFVAPPGVPADRAKVLQAAFMATHRDPQFLDEANRSGLYVSPVDAEQVMDSLERMSRTPPELIDRLRRILEGRGG
jgi:tripartite-type tricarboxylate transporter receptor subunit TctC